MCLRLVSSCVKLIYIYKSHLVRVRREVARGHAHEHKDEDCRCEQSPAVGRREESKHRAEDGDGRHGEKLHARTKRRAQKNRVWWRPVGGIVGRVKYQGDFRDLVRELFPRWGVLGFRVRVRFT